MAFRIWLTLCKLVQRQTYSCLSTRHGLWFAFTGLCIILVSAFHFGEILIEWSMFQSSHFQFGKYYDNIAHKSFEDRLCMPQPIDVVYTWVNGSDPKLIEQITNVKKKLEAELNLTAQLNYQEKKSRNKLINSDRFKWKNTTICPVPNCVPALKMAITGLPRNMLKNQLFTINSLFTHATDLSFWDDEIDVAFITFNNRSNLHTVLQTKIKYKLQLLNTSEVFYTGTVRSGHKRIDNCVMVYNYQKKFDKESIENKINQKYPQSLVKIESYNNDTLFVLHLKNEQQATTLISLNKKKTSFKVNSKKIKFFPVTYIWKPLLFNFESGKDDFSQNRFADNNELKYSLRSVEKFAPWVRNIYIVTNGQIPTWLNLDNPRLKIITHKEIFVNKSHLPTFSSPAIETHIHRIPGLSKKFVYMNDDVFFGAPVWPDDFMTYSKGQKVFLTWSVPNCNTGCPSSWINDKYCDKACNVSSCDWDGGDCIGSNVKASWQLGAQQIGGYASTSLGESCAPGCANNWIGDRYCDGNCNNAACGYDAGDCGPGYLRKLFSYTLSKKDDVTITPPKGTVAFYVNLTNIFSGGIIDGNHDESKCLRIAVLSKHFKILSISLYSNVSSCNISFDVLGYKDFNKTLKFVARFNVSSNTVQPTAVSTTSNTTLLEHTFNNNTEVLVPDSIYNDTYYFKNFDQVTTEAIVNKISFEELLNSSRSNEFKNILLDLKRELDEGYLTEYGFQKQLKGLLAEHQKTSKNHASRKLLAFNEVSEDIQSFNIHSFLQWERHDYLSAIQKRLNQLNVMRRYETQNVHRRHLFDTFSSSLLHVSRIYNKAFGYRARKVPAHMPHFVDRDIISEMQEKFHPYFDKTSSHKIRHPEDMQFAFAYNYFVIGVKDQVDISKIFDDADTDHSGHLSDRELRSLAAILYPIPISLEKIHALENAFKNCSKRLLKNKTTNKEKYYDNQMPLVDKELFMNCTEVWNQVNLTETKKTRYNHEIVGEDQVIFKMIRNNVSVVLAQLDSIRKERKKFICLNDDLDHSRADTKVIRNILRDFYESLFPIPSQFELPKNFRNKFLYKDDLLAWEKEKQHSKLVFNLYVSIVIFILLTYLLRKKIFSIIRKLISRYRRNIYVSEI